MYGNQGLSHPLDTFTNQFVTISHGNPGFPVQLNIHPVINNYLPYIATLCMEIVQSKARENPLRVLMFNRLGMNYFNNQDFLSLVKTAGELAEFRMAQNQHQQIEPVLMQSCSEAAEMFAAYQVEKFPVLTQMLPPQLVQAAITTLNAAKQQFAAISQYQMSRNQPQTAGYSYAPPVQNQFGGGYMSQPNTYAQPYVVGSQPTQSPQQSGIFNYGGTQNTPLMEKPQTVSRATYNVGGSEVSTTPAVSTVTQPISQPAPAPVVQQEPPVVPAPGLSKKKMRVIFRPGVVRPTPNSPALRVLSQSEVQFHATEEIPYDTTCDGIRTEKFYLTDEKGSLRPFVHQLTKEETVKREIHLRDTNPVAHDLYRNSNTDVDRIETLIKNNDWIKTPEVYEEQREDSLELSKSGVRVTGLCFEEITLLQQAKLEEKRQETGDDKSLYADIAIAFRPQALVSKKNAKEIANKFLTCENFMEVTNRIKDMLANSQQDGDSDLLKIANFFCSRLDKELQSFIHRKLGLDINIESFVVDAVDVISYIERQRSPIFSDYLRTHQTQIIKNVFTPIDDVVADQMEVCFSKSDEHNGHYHVTFFGITEVHIYADLTQFDLRIDVDDIDTISKKISCETYHSVILEKLCSAAFKLMEEEQEKDSKVFLTTQEGLHFEINRSFLDNQVYTISAVE